MADGYQPQLNPGGQSDYGSAPSNFGQPVAAALEYAGDAMDSAIHQIRDKNRDAEATAAGVAFAQNSAKLDQAAIAARNTAAPGGDGHVQNVNSMIDGTAADALGSIKDRHIRQVFTDRYAQFKNQLSTREYGWQAGQYVSHLAFNVKEATDTYAEGQAANPDLNMLPTQLSAIHDTIQSTSLDGNLKEQLVKEQQRAVVLANAQAMVRTDPRTLIGNPDTGQQGILQRPEYYQYLEPAQIDALRHSGEVEIRRQDTMAREKANRDKAQAVQTLSLAQDQIGKGMVPSQDDWTNWQGLATKYDLPKEQFDFGVLKDKSDINQQYRTATPVTLQHDINELEAKQAAGTTTQAENIRLKNLREYAGPAIEQFNRDPYAFAAKAGNEAPPIDFTASDPAQLQSQAQQRVAWARAFAASSGLVNVPYLSGTEKQLFTDRMKQGPAGQLETTTALRNTFGGAVATDIVKQLAPGNKDVELMVGLPPRVGELYSRGVQAVQGGTVKLGSTGPDAATDKQNLIDVFNTWKGAIPVDMQPAFKRAADNVTAGIAAEFGRSEPTGDELKNAYGQAMQRVAGMIGSPAEGSATGGIANWQGNPVWLPQTMSRDEFQHRMSTAGKADWIKAAGGAPYYQGPDGKITPLNDQQIALLPGYRMQTIKPGVYQLLGPNGGHVMQKDGRTPWQFDIRNLR